MTYAKRTVDDTGRTDAERERDEAQHAADNWQDRYRLAARAKDEAEAERDRYRAALEELRVEARLVFVPSWIITRINDALAGEEAR